MNGRGVTLGWNIARLVMALVVAAAVVAQLQVSISSAREFGRDVATTVANFFSFFTILSNVSAAVVLAVAGVWGLRAVDTPRREPRGLAIAALCASTFMIVTGIVYNALLRGIELPQGSTLPWSNEVLHLVGPLFMVADVVVAPRRLRVAWSTLWAIVAVPVVWTIYTMVRGGLVTNPQTGDPWWYPYPFLDPHQVAGGWWGVLGYAVGIAVVIAGVAAGVVAVSRRRSAAD